MAHTHDSHHHHHHHHHGNVHPPAAVLPSLLRGSLAQRLVLAAGLTALLWLGAMWGMG
jgi:hypothetical protein